MDQDYFPFDVEMQKGLRIFTFKPQASPDTMAQAYLNYMRALFPTLDLSVTHRNCYDFSQLNFADGVLPALITADRVQHITPADYKSYSAVVIPNITLGRLVSNMIGTLSEAGDEKMHRAFFEQRDLALMWLAEMPDK